MKRIQEDKKSSKRHKQYNKRANELYLEKIYGIVPRSKKPYSTGICEIRDVVHDYQTLAEKRSYTTC